MKKYYIYSANTDKKIGEVNATSISSAEIKFVKNHIEYGSNEIYALTTNEDEAFA